MSTHRLRQFYYLLIGVISLIPNHVRCDKAQESPAYAVVCMNKRNPEIRKRCYYIGDAGKPVLPLPGKRHYLYYLGIQSKISRRTDIFIFITRNVLVNRKSSCLLSCNVNKFDPERVLVSTFPGMPY